MVSTIPRLHIWQVEVPLLSSSTPLHFPYINMASQSEQKVAEIIVESIYNAGVKVVFGIPGAKVDAVFDTLSGMIAHTLH